MDRGFRHGHLWFRLLHPARDHDDSYYASSENNWTVAILPHVPDWIIPVKEADLVRDFYEGRTDGVVPWGLWLPALLHWAPLALISIVLLLRKQWVDHERLP